ncbi:hypothetical protein FNV43_RR12639 [Rhamnella rubrinervis]|uniref:GRPD C-terminal domain-containing protein n=1 Tax=Rhamnella rubrinervis TaxID=2594499 RepID=A0A8K0H8C1_9ROSA|nr:hypothetical protein FNV43_RR12639 [Rhamnella rubrinervis]
MQAHDPPNHSHCVCCLRPTFKNFSEYKQLLSPYEWLGQNFPAEYPDGKDENEQNFKTGVEFSTEYHYGKAVALLNLKFGFLEVASPPLKRKENSVTQKVADKECSEAIANKCYKCSESCGHVNEAPDNNVDSKEQSDYGDQTVKYGNKYQTNWVKCNLSRRCEDGNWHKDKQNLVVVVDMVMMSSTRLVVAVKAMDDEVAARVVVVVVDMMMIVMYLVVAAAEDVEEEVAVKVVVVVGKVAAVKVVVVVISGIRKWLYLYGCYQIS